MSIVLLSWLDVTNTHFVTLIRTRKGYHIVLKCMSTSLCSYNGREELNTVKYLALHLRLKLHPIALNITFNL
jgi:hypothetical protein